MIRTINISILFILINTTYAQQFSSDFHDEKVWFKVKDEVVLKKREKVKGEKGESTPSTLASCLMELSAMEKTLSSLDIINLKHFSSQKLSPELARTFELQVDAGTKLDKLIRKLIMDPAVEYAEKIPVNKKHYSPNDPSYGPGNQWYLYQIDAEQAWSYSQGNSNIVVAIVDDAVDIDHPDLSGVLWTNSGEIANNGYDDDNNGYVDDVNGADVVNGTGNPRPSTPTSNYEHGTHVAGCAAAASDNNIGIASIGFGVSIMSLRCSDNSGLLSNTYDGVLYAIQNGANVINMSYGSNYYSNTSQNLFNWANQNDIVLIASAGNDGSSTKQYPAAYNHVISVAATNGNDAKASFSNYDNGSGWVDLAAPGTSIYSTLPTGSGSYGYKQGTSMSGPIVAGLAALMLSQNSGLTPSDVETCLKNNCDPVSGSYSSLLGAGRINASDVMACVSSTLSWAPQAEFEANVTTIAAGGTVNFTDLSIYNPTSWSWSFGGGGTPNTSSQQNPSGVVFTTAGTYTVSMTATNSNGNDVETKTSYITVNASTGCDTATNTLPGDTIFNRLWDNGNNYLGGTNNKGITVYCEYFQDIYPTGTYIQDLVMYFTIGETNTVGNTVDITIWEDNNGEPGNVLHTETLSMQEIEDNQTVPGNPNSFYPTVVNLSTPLLIQGDFYVGIEVSGADPVGEEAAIAYTHDFNYDNSGRSGSSWLYITSSNPWSVAPGWKNIETFLTGSPKYAMHIYARITSLPVSSQISASSQSVCQGDLVNFDGSASSNGSTYEWYVNGASSSYSTAVAPDFTFNSSGTHTSYLITYNTCGFYNIDSIDIVVNASPNVTLSASDLTLCLGDTSSLNAFGASTYSWSPSSSLSDSTGSSVTASPSASTTYTVVGRSGQCIGVANVSIVIEGTPVSDFKYVPDTNLCFNQSIYFDGAMLSSNATSYSWDFGNASPSASTSATQSVVFPSGGTYSVSLTVENGCNESDVITQNVDIGDCNYAGISEADDDWGIIRYLNYNNQLFIKMNSPYNTELELFNLLGEILYSTSFNGGGEYFIDLSTEPNGIYSYKLFSKSRSISAKFLKY